MILAVVVTYFPEEELLKKNIGAIIDNVDKVLIWENTPHERRMDYRFIRHEKVEYHGDDINSISHALNYAWQYAQENGYDHLLTMDQDSRFEDFQYYLRQTILNADAPAGIYTPSFEGMNMANDFEETTRPITSGMLIPVKLIDKIGGWNEAFQIDAVDDEFCLRAHTLDIKILAVKNALMHHRLGEPVTHKLLGHTIILRNYSPTRLYNIYKNNLLLIRSYPQFTYLKADFKGWLKNAVWVLLYEDNKVMKFAAIMRGIFAGLTTALSQPNFSRETKKALTRV